MGRKSPFKITLLLAAAGVTVVALATMLSLLWGSTPALKAFGWKFFFQKEWNPAMDRFGALPFLIGTLLTSFLALLLSLPLSLSISLLLGEYLKGGKLSSFIRSMVDLIAAVPSVIYGFWGLEVLVPAVREMEMKMDIVPYGVGIFTASLILSVMIIPNTASLAREVIQLVPRDLKEAAYSLGATRYEVIKKVVVPYARSGIIAGILLSLGRALGETMAVTMVIGNSSEIPKSLFSPANTMASVIANEFTEATEDVHLAALVEIGLLLFIITVIVNLITRIIIVRTKVR